MKKAVKIINCQNFFIFYAIFFVKRFFQIVLTLPKIAQIRCFLNSLFLNTKPYKIQNILFFLYKIIEFFVFREFLKKKTFIHFAFDATSPTMCGLIYLFL